MKKSLKITLVSALALFLLTGCAAAPASAAESVSATPSAADTPPSAALSDSALDTAVSKRDASGEYDASEAATLSPDGDLTITEAGTYILSGEYEGMIVIEAGEEDKVQLVLENAAITNENGPAIYVRSADKVFLTAAEGTVNLSMNGGAFGEGLYAICEMSGVTAADGAKFAPSNDTLAVSWSVDGDTLMLSVGDIDPNTWTGRAGDGNLSNPANWYGGVVPTSGTATINTSGDLIVGGVFSPDVIVFPATCQNVTISGENAITGISAITNLSTSTCTFEVPVAFADEICVSQGAYYYYNNSNDQPTLSDGGKVPLETDLSAFNNNGAFTTAVFRTTGLVCLRNEGEFVVTEELEMTLPGADRHIAQRASQSGKYKFEKVTLGDNGKAGVFYIANRGDWYTDKHVYVGAGGLCFAEGAQPNTAYAFGRRANDDIYIYPWHSDYTIGAKGGTTRDIIVIEPTYFQTDDADGVARTVTLNGVADVRHTLTVKGHGRFQVNSDGMSSGGITVTDSATLAYASGADLGAGAVTVGVNATMEVASGENTFVGGLTLNDGATLAFNFTQRAVTPQIAIAEGKSLTVKGAVKVKIPDGSLRPTGGEKVLTTCGGFAGKTVTLAADAPDWVKSLSVNTDGNLVLDVKPKGTMIIVR